MTLVLDRQAESKIPVEVLGITPDRLEGLNEREIAKLSIWIGNQAVELGELFRVQGKISDDQAIHWSGDLTAVHWIGAGMKSGKIQIDSPTGRHVGSRMLGGVIATASDVSDFAGAEMRGGKLLVGGHAGDLLGGSYPGSKYGMNLGEILVTGNAGRGVGQSLRRGLIAVGGNVDSLCGWNMLAGTILVFGNCGAECGAGMIRGSIVQLSANSAPLLPTFSRGGRYEKYFFGLTANRLIELGFPNANRLLEHQYQMYHGDLLRGGRGEIFTLGS